MQILFHRENQPIKGKIIKTTIEPLDSSSKRQVVFFCQDIDGKRYRVPKSEVMAKVVTATAIKEDKKKKKAKKKRRKAKK